MKKIISILLIFSLAGCGSTKYTYLNWDSATRGEKTAAVLMGIVTVGIWPDYVTRTSYNGYHHWTDSCYPRPCYTANNKEKAAAVIYGILTLGIYSAIQGFRGVSWSVDDDSSKDLEALGYLMENSTQNALAESISDNFGLSLERSQKVSKIIYHFSKIKSKRSISNRDAKNLYGSVLGVSFEQIKNAIFAKIEGDESQLEVIYETVADKNETSPEHIRDLVESYMTNF